jgi:general secretion pathway protein M
VTGQTAPSGDSGLAAGWRLLSQQAVARWQALGARERAAVAIGAAVLGLFVLWSVAIAPALKTLNTAPTQIDQLEAQLQRMQRLAAEARDLRALPPVTSAQANLALKSSTDRLGSGAQLVVQGDRATLTLTGVPADALRSWLGEVRSAARARPVEVRLTQGAKGYSGSVVIAIGGAS